MHPNAPRSHRHLSRWLAAAVVTVLIALALLAGRPSAPRPATKPTTTATVLYITGQGDATPPAFATGPDWSVTYTYNCPSAGTFRVVERGGVQNGVAVADHAGTGTSATTYVHAVPGIHRLQVETGCTWTITVVNGDTMPRAGGVA